MRTEDVWYVPDELRGTAWDVSHPLLYSADVHLRSDFVIGEKNVRWIDGNTADLLEPDSFLGIGSKNYGLRVAVHPIAVKGSDVKVSTSYDYREVEAGGSARFDTEIQPAREFPMGGGMPKHGTGYRVKMVDYTATGADAGDGAGDYEGVDWAEGDSGDVVEDDDEPTPPPPPAPTPYLPFGLEPWHVIALGGSAVALLATLGLLVRR